MEDTDNCSQNCINTIGSYQCYCDEGYTLDSDDLHTCNGIYFIHMYVIQNDSEIPFTYFFKKLVFMTDERIASVHNI